MSHPIDRRCSPRISCDLEVEYKARGTDTRMGRITNIGIGGMCLTTQRVLPPLGADLFLHFRLPLSRRAVQAGGTVRWAAPGTAGVELIHMNLQAQDEIWRYYAKESARQRAGAARPPEPSVPIRGPDVLRESVLNAWRRFIREHG
jgi:hypothetical protein